MNGSEGQKEAETSADATESSDCTNISATTTTKTTFDELMQALSELEADEPVPSSTQRAPSWREFVANPLIFSHC